MSDEGSVKQDDPHEGGEEVDSLMTYALVWGALMVLLALTVVSATLISGGIGTAVGLAVATVKAGLVVWIFMQLRHHHGLTRVASFFALLWLAILITLMLADYLTRVRVVG